jgi:hypothetical protein
MDLIVQSGWWMDYAIVLAGAMALLLGAPR